KGSLAMTVADVPKDEQHAYLHKEVIAWNTHMVWEIRRRRTERLMNVLRTIEGLPIKRSRILCIGPRNEAEILLLSLYGFPIDNIVSIDLFSYSDLIQVMDMHDLKFPADSFDIVY